MATLLHYTSSISNHWSLEMLMPILYTKIYVRKDLPINYINIIFIYFSSLCIDCIQLNNIMFYNLHFMYNFLRIFRLFYLLAACSFKFLFSQTHLYKFISCQNSNVRIHNKKCLNSIVTTSTMSECATFYRLANRLLKNL